MIVLHCPHCGEGIEDDSPETFPDIGLTPSERKLVRIMLKLEWVSAERLIFFMWAAEGKEEPDTARTVLHVMINRIRRKLKPHGQTVARSGSRAGASIYSIQEIAQ